MTCQNLKTNMYRDVSTGATVATTGVTAIAPKFSDTLTFSNQGGGRFCPSSVWSHLDFPRGYVPDVYT